MLMQPSNFLLLDEPTNHLDMQAKDVLLTALQEYSGTVVFVSHDRYFIDKLATRVFEVEDGKVQVFPGNYEDYQWRKQGQADAAAAGETAPEAPEEEAAQLSSAEPGARTEKRLNPIKLRQMRERQDSIEVEVAKLEAGIAECEDALSNFVSVEETMRVNALLEARRGELGALLGEWEEVSHSIEASA
jgi:ATP-binding cassette subfamily F protein 3